MIYKDNGGRYSRSVSLKLKKSTITNKPEKKTSKNSKITNVPNQNTVKTSIPLAHLIGKKRNIQLFS